MMSEFVQQKTNSYCSKSEIDKIKTIFLFEESFTQWRSSEHMNSSLEKPAEKFSAKLRKKICWMAENIETITVFQKIFGNFLWTRWLQSRQHCPLFSLEIGEQKKITLFRKFKLPLKCSPGHINSSFDNPAGKSLSDNQKKFAQAPKNDQNKASSENLFVKTSFWIHKTQFRQRAWSPSNKSRKIYAPNRKAWNWTQQFEKKPFHIQSSS